MAALKNIPNTQTPKPNQNASYLVIRLFLVKDHAKGHSSLTQRLFKHHLIHDKWELQTGTNSKKWTFFISCYHLDHWWQYISSESSGGFEFSSSGEGVVGLCFASFFYLLTYFTMQNKCLKLLADIFSLLKRFFIGFHIYLEVDFLLLKK